MAHVEEFIKRHPEQQPLYAQAWHAIIATDATTFSDKIFVTIPAFDETQRWGPCRWQSRDGSSLPARGDSALVIFDERRECWITAWWPFAS